LFLHRDKTSKCLSFCFVSISQQLNGRPEGMRRGSVRFVGLNLCFFLAKAINNRSAGNARAIERSCSLPVLAVLHAHDPTTAPLAMRSAAYHLFMIVDSNSLELVAQRNGRGRPFSMHAFREVKTIPSPVLPLIEVIGPDTLQQTRTSYCHSHSLPR